MSTRRILVIDNVRIFRGVIAGLLRPMTSISVPTGEVGLELIADGDRFDAILCELRSAGMSGPAFVEAVRTRSPEQASRVILMGEPGDRDFKVTAPGRWLERPFSQPELHSKITRVASAAATAATARFAPFAESAAA